MIKKAFIKGLTNAWRYQRIMLVIYVTTLVLAGLAALPFKGLFESKSGNSLIVSDLVKGFDYTFLNDFLQNYGEGFLPIWDQAVLVVGIHFVIMVFLMGGTVKLLVIQPKQFDRAMFWGATGYYFWRMLRLTVYFLIIHGAVLAFFVFLFLKITKGMSPEKLDDELIIVDALKWLSPFYCFIGAFFFMWQDYAKIFLIQNDHRYTGKPILNALKFVIANFRKTYGLYLLNILILVMVLLANHFLSCTITFDAIGSILLAFVLSQLFVLSRVFLKIGRLSSAAELLKINRASNTH